MTKRIVAGNDSAFTYVRLKYGSNPTDTVTGVIIYPDDFTFSEAGVGAMNFGANYAVTQIDAVTWEALEDVGCVFLPGVYYTLYTGGIVTINETEYGNSVFYWSSTSAGAGIAHTLAIQIRSKTFNTTSNGTRCYMRGVRLVQDL